MAKFSVKNYIEVTTIFRGFHQWETAPQAVEFLRAKHRHTFFVKVKMPVIHNNRDQEFFLVQHQVDTIIAMLYDKEETVIDNARVSGCNLGNRSCEMIGAEIGDKLFDLYPAVNYLEISVSEDNENFGIVELTREIEEKESGIIELNREDIKEA